MTDQPNTESSPRITQEMIALYDDYTHLSLDRRKFMSQLARLAGSATAATTAAAMMAADAQAESMVSDADPRLETDMIRWGVPGGDMQGYWARPVDAPGPLPSVIVVHENRGLNEHIRDVTRRVALEGFNALAPDFLSLQGGTPEDEDAARGMFRDLDPHQTAKSGVATVMFLKDHRLGNGKVGAMGFCWGGGTVNQIAVNAEGLDAGVAYYGAQPAAADVPNIKARMLLHYAGLDSRINAGIEPFQAALDAAGVDYALHIYEGVNHAFNNDTSEARYDPEAADLAFMRTIDFFNETLR